MLEQHVPEGLLKETHDGAVCDELQPVGRTHVGKVCGGLSLMGWTPCWSRERMRNAVPEEEEAVAEIVCD